MENNTFSKENIEALKKDCSNIISLLTESDEGIYMASQLLMLGETITKFLHNPIIVNSGLLE